MTFKIVASQGERIVFDQRVEAGSGRLDPAKLMREAAEAGVKQELASLTRSRIEHDQRLPLVFRHDGGLMRVHVRPPRRCGPAGC